MKKSKLIKAGIRKGFKAGNSKIADKVCYGYTKAADGSLVVNEREAQIVCWIFERYISGDSLGKIRDSLAAQNIPRCANRVEHGKEICKHSSTVLDETVKKFVCHALSS